MQQLTARSMRLACILASLVASTCSADFHSAQVTGFVKRKQAIHQSGDPDRGPGINGVTVRFYTDEPDSFEDSGFVAETATSDNRAAGTALAGFYSHRVVWSSSSSEFGEDADARTLWIATSDADHEPAIVKVERVLSDTINFVPDVLLDPLTVGPTRLTGRVMMTGVGIDGVRVAVAFGAEEPGRFFVISRTVDEVPGMFIFDDIRWDSDEGNSKMALVAVEDAAFFPANRETVELLADREVTLAAPLQTVSSAFVVGSVRGRVVDSWNQGVNGVRVSMVPEVSRYPGFSWTSVSAAVDGVNGVYRFERFAWLLPNGVDFLVALNTQDVLIEVADDAYEQLTNEGEAITVPIPQLQDIEVRIPLLVARSSRTTFDASLQGRCVRASSDGVAGVEVTLRYRDEDGERELTQRTDPEGHYAFFLQWRRAMQNDSSAGEDEIDAMIDFSSVESGENTLQFESIELSVRSWVAPNYAPDAVAISASDDAG